MIDLDINNQPVVPQILLAYKDGRTIGNLFYDEKSLNIKVELEDNYILTSEMSCDVYNLNTSFWDKITDFKLIYIPIEVPYIKTSGFWYEITVTIDDVDKTIKHVVGTLAQYSELDNVYNYEVEIRTENDMNRDDYVDTVFYNPDNPDASIINRVLKDKAPHYSIYYVEDSLKNVKRTFEFNGDSVLECLKKIAEEVGCIIIFGESLHNNVSYSRSISFYEGKDYCPACGKRGDFTNGCTNPDCSHNQEIIPRYGEEIGLFVNKENLGENINLSTNVEEVKNCYRLTAGDDNMTAAVIDCNPSGSRYIWHFTDTMKQDMSDNLKTAINSYISLYNSYKTSYEMLGVAEPKVVNYNSYISTYSPYMAEDTRLSTISYPIIGYTDLIRAYYYATYLYDFLNILMIPDSPAVEDTTAEEQMELFTLTSIGVRALVTVTKTTAANEVKEAVKIYIDSSRYNVSVSTTSFNSPTWIGTITLTSSADVEDTYTINKQLTFTDASEDYIKNQIDQLLKKHETNIVGIKTLLNASANDFTTEIGKYSLSYLSIIASTISSVLSILDDAGVTQSSNPDIYNEIYAPYSQKYSILNNEISVRETQVNNIKSLINDIKAQRIVINEALKLEDYLSEELWLELLSFRREGEIENNNYISEGLNNKELIDNAMDFYDKAREDIEKQAELQYTITASLKNLLLFMTDDLNFFDVGDWIHIEVDEHIYKLRMISYEINYSDLSNIQTKFTDVKKFKDITTQFAEYKKSISQNKQKIEDTNKQVIQLQSISNVISDEDVIVDEESGQTLGEYIKEEQVNTTIAIDNASKKATYYLSVDDSGVVVADMSDGTYYAPSEIPTGKKNIFIDDDSLDVRDGQTVLANFGSILTLGKTDGTQSYLRADYHSLQMIDRNGKTFFYVSDLRDADNYATLHFTGDGRTTEFNLGVYILNIRSVKINGSATTAYTKSSNNVITFNTAPSNGSDIEITLQTNAINLKAYTLGTRKSNSIIGKMSFVSGYENVASSQYSHAEGMETVASGSCAHSEGSNTTASDGFSHAEGHYTTASGFCAHSEGSNTTASGGYSHAEGMETVASGFCAHSEGSNTTASGGYSHAEGGYTTAGGEYSHAQNRKTIASGDCQTACGKYNIEDTDDKYAVIVGNGDFSSRSNAFAINWDGDIEIALDLGADYLTTDDGKLADLLGDLNWLSSVIV